MARKKEPLSATFETVAKPKTYTENVNNDIKDNVNSNINDDVETNNDVNDNTKDIEDIIGKKKSEETVLKGIHLQKGLAKKLDKLAKKGGRGAMSRIANEAFKEFFDKRGL